MLLAVLLVLPACSVSRTVDSPELGKPAPDFALPTLSGEPLRLSEQRGRVVIVNFWASWCGPCVTETPRLVGWYERHGAAGLAILGVDALHLDARPNVEAFARDYKVSYPILLDEEGTVSKQWRAQQLPRSYVLDREGIVRFVRIGELTDADFEQQVLPLLESSTADG